MSKCFRCSSEIPEPSMESAIDREQNFRENFPQTWDDEDERVLVCDKCFDEMQDDTDEWERSEL